MKTVPLVVVGLLAWSLLVPLASAQDAKDWKQYNYDNTGWRFNASEVTLSPANADRLEQKWKFPVDGSDQKIGIVHATPIIVNGFVYFGTTRTNPSFYKLSPSGKLVWEYRIESVITAEEQDPYIVYGAEHVSDGVMNAALVDGDRVYFGTFGGQVICLNRFDGREVWRVKTKQPPFPSAHGSNTVMSSPIMADGKLIVAGGGFEHQLGAAPGYPCCSGRGFVAAFEPETGEVIWTFDVGPIPETFPEPVPMLSVDGTQKEFVAGPSTSSVWCTPSYDPESRTLFFGTDTHNAPRRPTPDDARLYNEYSSAIIAIDVGNGKQRWVRQLVANDVWNNALPAYDPETGEYKDLSIGDTPKLYSIEVAGKKREVIGVGCKDGSFYVIDRTTGQIIYQTPTFRGPPEPTRVALRGSRVLALPSVIGGLQTGCAFDGHRVYVNGIDWPGLCVSLSRRVAMYPPSGGRVTAIAPTTLVEHWRHERPKVNFRSQEDGKQYHCGDPVASGIAVGGGLLFFTTNLSGKLSVLDAADGTLLKDFKIGPVWCGPSVSRGRVYVGSGNNLFRPWNAETEQESPGGFALPLTEYGAVYCFGLTGDDEVDRLPEIETGASTTIEGVVADAPEVNAAIRVHRNQ